MRLNEIFRRLVLSELNEQHMHKTGRPKTLTDEQALDCAFKILRTGMQWREIEAPVSYAKKFNLIFIKENQIFFKNSYYQI